MRSSIDRDEIAHFAKDSRHWWDEQGPFKPLHRLNPVRMGYIRDRLCAQYDRDPRAITPLSGLDIIDIGCGGGLVSEPLARMGANVTGIDADGQAIDVARVHAEGQNLSIAYQCIDAAEIDGRFDAVIALEIVEHVADVDAFIQNCARLCKPGGLVILSTLNRTARSFALGIVAAEYVLRWVPRGTHNWQKFLRPAELAMPLRQNGCAPKDIKGVIYNPLKDEFNLSDSDIAVNYIMTSEKSP